MRGRLRKIAGGILMVGLALAVCEFGAAVILGIRALIQRPDPGTEMTIARDRVRAVHRPVRSEHFNVSAAGWRMLPGAVDQWSRDSKGKARIYMFGGSTMFSSSTADDATIPVLVEERLRHEFDVLTYNLGVGGNSLQQETMLLVDFLHQGDIPDVVVFYDGINEIEGGEDLLGEYVEIDPQYHHFAAMAQALEKPLEHSFWRQFSIVRAARSVSGANSRDSTESPRSHRDMTRAEALQRVGAWTQAHASRLRMDVKFLQVLANAYGFELVLLLQPHYLWGRNDAPADPLKQTRALAYQMLWHQLLSQDEPRWIDLSRVLDHVDPNTVYVDPQHLNAAGNAIVADAMCNVLRPVLKRRW